MVTSKLWKIRKGRLTRKAGNVFSSFGKGNNGSISLNYGRSSGKNCSRNCRYHADSTNEDAIGGCYSTTNEYQRRSVRNFLDDQEDRGALQTIGLAMIHFGELLAFAQNNDDTVEITWLRFSSAGSVPFEHQIPAADKKRYEKLLRQFIVRVLSHGVKVHFPVEDETKRAYYHRLIGDLVTIRLSAQSESEFLSTSAPCSFVGGVKINSATHPGQVKKARIVESKRLAKLRYETTGRKTIVCPAIVSTFEKRDRKILCGDCTACANSNIDVIYPLHV